MTAMFALTVVNLAIYMIFFRKQRNVYILLVFIVMMVSCFGHWLLGFSGSTEGANVANKINYIGAAFVPIFMYLSLVEVCGVKIARWIRLTLISFGCVVLAMVLTVGFSPIYYKTFEFVLSRGVGNYTETFGWGHNIFNAVVFSSGILDTILIVYALRLTVSFKNILAMFMTEMVTLSSFLLSRFLDCDTLVMPIVYVVNQWLMLYICSNVKWYDIANSVYEAMEDENTCAYISFSAEGRYLGCNLIAEKFFQELPMSRVGSCLSSETKLGPLFNFWIAELKKNDSLKQFHFRYMEKHFKCTVLRTNPAWRRKLFLFKVEDDTDVRMYIDNLDKNNDMLQKLVRKNKSAAQTIQKQMVMGMAMMVDSRDGNTGGHIKRTSEVVRILVEDMRRDATLNLPRAFFDTLIKAAPMHDIGKIAIDDSVLRKPGKFTDEEYAEMKTHSEKGAFMIENLLTKMEDPFVVRLTKNVAYYHHERWDGKGYPKGLAGEDIPLEARIMAVADVYDALVSRRCYKDRLAFDDAYKIIVSGMGSQFDPFMQKYFEDCNNQLKQYYLSVDH